ncbi:uncharacterized protein TNCV_1318521 [Trichonephila clavipes]|nr:uncharacterized protein TNCV_1318521 [Trichonephila clavipes]
MRIKKGNESNRAIVTSEIISIAKEIGGEGFDDFGEHDIEELLVDEALNDDDILESMVDITKDLETVDSEPEEDVTPLDEKLLREGLQLSGKLANFFFIQNDNDVERALKFQRDLKFCMSGYRELYKELVPSQSLITDYLVKEKKITEVPEEALPCRSDDVILSSSDESDLAPIHKRALKLRASCGCPRLAYGDPREKISSLIKETEASRKAYFEQHKKPVVIFKV